MKSSLLAAGIAALVGAVAAMAAAASGLSPFDMAARGVGKKMVYATIYLDQVGGDCFINTSPQTIEMFKKETIEWTIVDRCGVTLAAEVEVVFKGDNPLDPACVAKGKKKIRCSLSNAATIRAYKYDVKGGTALPEDPELEIVQ